MGLALCHVLPRDNLLRLCIFLMTSGFILQAIALGMRNDRSSVGNISGGTSAVTLQGDLSVRNDATSAIFCDATNNDPCKTYIKRATEVAGILLAAFITCPIVVLLVALVVAPFTSTTARMVNFFWLLTLIPSILTVVAMAHFFNSAVPALTDITGGTFYRGNIANLLIASCALYIVNFLLTSLRAVLSMVVRPGQKQQVIESRDINGVVSLHMVNDDWKRQNDMWDMHARSVQVEVLRKKQRQPDAVSSSPNNRQRDENEQGNATMTSVGTLEDDREYRRQELENQA